MALFDCHTILWTLVLRQIYLRPYITFYACQMLCVYNKVPVLFWTESWTNNPLLNPKNDPYAVPLEPQPNGRELASGNALQSQPLVRHLRLYRRKENSQTI